MQISYEYDGFPEFLRSEGACKRAVELGRIGADTPIVVYEENGERTRTVAGEHPVLRALLGLASPAEELPADAQPPPEQQAQPVFQPPVSDGSPDVRVPLRGSAPPVPVTQPAARRPVQTTAPNRVPPGADTPRYWMTLALRNYADFQGRARRKEYWMFTLLVTLATVLAVILGGAESSVGGLLLLVIVLGGLIPGLAVTVRRLHDLGLSGWLVLIGLLPYVGGLVLLILMLLDGKPGTNQYGPNPKESFDASVFE